MILAKNTKLKGEKEIVRYKVSCPFCGGINQFSVIGHVYNLAQEKAKIKKELCQHCLKIFQAWIYKNEISCSLELQNKQNPEAKINKGDKSYEVTCPFPSCKAMCNVGVSSYLMKAQLKRKITIPRNCPSCRKTFYFNLQNGKFDILIELVRIKKKRGKKYPRLTSGKKRKSEMDYCITSGPLKLIPDCLTDEEYRKYFPGGEHPIAVSRSLNPRETEEHLNKQCEYEKRKGCVDMGHDKGWKAFSCKECPVFKKTKKTVYKISAI